MKRNSRFGVSGAAGWRRGLRHLGGVVAAAAGVTFASAADNWVGAVRCEINVTAPGYTHQETQTWTLAGTPPTPQGSSKIYAATWSVTGQGWLDTTNASSSRRIASWTASVSGRSAPVSFLVTPAGELFVQVAHAQLTAQAGYTGTDVVIQNGAVFATQRLQATVYEWPFQRIQGLPADTTLTGTHTSRPNAFLGPLQPSGAQVTVTCVWALGQGSAPPLPPSSLPPQAPVPTTPGSSPPTTNQPGTATPANDGSVVVRPGGRFEDGPKTGGATISPTPVPIEPPRDPTNFTATQVGEGMVELRWDPVPGVSNYSVLGPGVTEGRRVSATSTIVAGLPIGTHEWVVTSWYEPDGSQTPADQWPRASLTVTSNSGRYRVTATRLRIHREEPDNRFKEHGRNNEIFLTTHAQIIDRRTGKNRGYDGLDSHPGIRQMIRSTPIHGDTHNANAGTFQYRIRAGSVAASGGIQTGDEIQIWDADQMHHRSLTFGHVAPGEGMASHPSPGVFLTSEQKPFVLWEGNLNAGAEVTLLRPVVWLAINTWEGGSRDQFLDPYLDRVVRVERSRDFLGLPAIRDAVGRLPGLVVKVPSLATTGQWLVDRHRPFGLEVEGNQNGAPATAADRVVVLTQEKVEAFLAGRQSAELELRIAGTMRGPNAIEMGDCSLFLTIERLPPVPPPSSPRDPIPPKVEPPPPNREGWTPPPASETSGRYRITGTRVFMHREEHDNRFKTHGRNNEIAVSKHALVIDRRTNAKVAFDPSVVISPVHGDHQNSMSESFHTEFRIRAGSVSPSGGIQTGDDVAIRTTAGKPAAAMIADSECIPFVFWEGELNDGAEVVLIRPVVWLISAWLWADTNSPHWQWTNGEEFLAPYMIRVENERWTDFLALPPIQAVLNEPGVSLVNVPQLVTVGGWLMSVHRPFGLAAQAGTVGEPYGRPSTWTDRVLVLTREKIEHSLGGRRDIPFELRLQSTLSSNRFPMGDCSLFLKIERLP